MYAAPPAAPAPIRRERTTLIVVAQTLMVVKGIFWLIAGLGLAAFGIYLIADGNSFTVAHGSRNHPGLGAIEHGMIGLVIAVLIMAAGVLIAGGLADIILGVVMGRPSNVARWLTIVLNTITGVIALFGIVSDIGNHRGTGGAAMVLAVWLAVNFVIFYALVIDERSRQAFG